MPNRSDIEISIFEIDPKKKYVLQCDVMPTVQEVEDIKNEIKKWLADDKQPFLIITGDLKLVKVQDVEKV